MLVLCTNIARKYFCIFDVRGATFTKNTEELTNAGIDSTTV